MPSDNKHWKKSMWTKLIAACFIGLILLGNVWLVMAFSAKVPPVWLQNCFVGLVGSVFVFGAALGAEQLLRAIMEKDRQSNEVDTEDTESN